MKLIVKKNLEPIINWEGDHIIGAYAIEGIMNTYEKLGFTTYEPQEDNDPWVLVHPDLTVITITTVYDQGELWED